MVIRNLHFDMLFGFVIGIFVAAPFTFLSPLGAIWNGDAKLKFASPFK